MSFTCPECRAGDALRIVRSLELPSDARSDEITLQIVSCNRCRFAGIAVYEESRRGALDDDSFDHTGYRVSKRDLAALRRAMASCPEPRNPRCRCPAHREYGRRNARGRWSGLDAMELGLAFRMDR
jgi:hypothetical protein